MSKVDQAEEKDSKRTYKMESVVDEVDTEHKR